MTLDEINYEILEKKLEVLDIKLDYITKLLED